MGFQSLLTKPQQKAQEALMRAYHSDLTASKALNPNQSDATPGKAKRVENPHKHKPLKGFRPYTDASVKRHKENAERVVKYHKNYREILADRTKVEEEETKTHAAQTDYEMGRRTRENQEQAKNAENVQHAANLIPEQKARYHEVDHTLNLAIYDSTSVAQEYLLVKGW